jgi:hypothetical protein
MSIYDKESYSQSKTVFLGGPIEHWWNSKDDPYRFESDLAKTYRAWRNLLNDTFVWKNYLVYRPHEAFKGPWNEAMQGVNDYVLERSHAFVNMTPTGYGVVALGTDHETRQAVNFGVPVFHAPFPHGLVGKGNSLLERSRAAELANFFVSEVDRSLAELLH